MKTNLLTIFFILLLAFVFTGCGEKGDEAASVGAYAETDGENALDEARSAALEANPSGQEFLLEDEGIFIMLPDDSWTESSREEGCIGFSQAAGLINVYYGDDDGTAYEAVPESEADARKILEGAQIPEEWAEFLSFDSHTEGDSKIYSYTIRFSIPYDDGSKSVFYTVSKSICRKDKVFVAVGQIYDEGAVEECETALKSFVVIE